MECFMGHLASTSRCPEMAAGRQLPQEQDQKLRGATPKNMAGQGRVIIAMDSAGPMSNKEMEAVDLGQPSDTGAGDISGAGTDGAGRS